MYRLTVSRSGPKGGTPTEYHLLNTPKKKDTKEFLTHKRYSLTPISVDTGTYSGNKAFNRLFQEKVSSAEK